MTYSLFAMLPGCGGGGSTSGGNGGNGDVATYRYFTTLPMARMSLCILWVMLLGRYQLLQLNILFQAVIRKLWLNILKPYLYITTVLPVTRTVRVLSITPATGGLTDSKYQ